MAFWFQGEIPYLFANKGKFDRIRDIVNKYILKKLRKRILLTWAIFVRHCYELKERESTSFLHRMRKWQ